jgi:tripartite-type tricarboxylate transporter receptor subunit TctC
LIGAELTKRWGKQVVVDIRPGAGTIIGTELVVKAPADGYTLLMSPSTLAINPATYKKLPYDVLRDFVPVSLVATTPLILAVHPSQPVTTVAELITLAKARPGELFFPSAGTGDAPHLAAELFNMTAGVKLMHVPYKGAAIGINDLVAGRLALMFGTSPATLPHVRSGRLRAIAVTSRTRSAVMPELPTVTESGLAGYEAGSWYGMLAPARTPKAVVARVAAAVSAAVASNDLSEKLKAQGVDVIGNTPEQFNAYIRQEIIKWAKVIQAAGINAGAAH